MSRQSGQFSRSVNPKQTQMATSKPQRKRSAAPTIAQSLRNKENSLVEKYYASLTKVHVDIPSNIRIGSEGDDIAEIRLQIMRSMIDPKNFDVFLMSSFGKYLLEGINDPEKVEKQGITRVSEFIKEQNNFQKATQRAKFDACIQQSRIDVKKGSSKREVSRSSLGLQSRSAFYKQHLDYVHNTRIPESDQLRINKLVKGELARLQKQLQKSTRPLSF